MNVIITGATGFIGQHLQASLKEHHHILGLTDDKTLVSAEILYLNLLDDKQIEAFGRKYKAGKIDGIIHLAAAMADPMAKKDSNLLKNNLQVAVNTARLAELIKPQFFINFSSVAVYPNKDGFYTESSAVDMVENNDVFYGLAKFNAEVLFERMLSDKMTVTQLRLAQIIGKGMRPDRILPVFFKELRDGNQITVFGNGHRVINFIFTDEVVAVLKKILKQPVSGIFNLGSDEQYTLGEIAGYMVKQYGNKATKLVLRKDGLRCQQKIVSAKLKKEWNIKNIPFKLDKLKVIENAKA
ncbi:MAG: NAD(P)-dependent oxidoreductase [Candidatus Omnitrophica bacterium]|nr:NAD(P)-dependent oxidoreductase [Candidatus Omnitrophota bacterium]